MENQFMDVHDFIHYPRKQLKRKDWQNLNGEWDFAFDDQAIWEKPADVVWNRKIIVPFAPESEASGIGDTGFHSQVWYRKSFLLKHPAARTKIHFGAVDYEAHIWLNGHYLGSHEGGHTSFSFEITHELLNQNEEQTVIVCAYDDPLDLAKPRGKQDWKEDPHSIWYPRTTGIWQTVWLEPLPETYIHRLVWTPTLERWEVGIEAFMSGLEDCDSLQLRVTLSLEGKILAQDRYQVVHREVHRRIAFSDPGIDDYRNEILWSPEKPTLISATVELINGESVIDKIESYTALRSVGIQRDRFMLNGRPYYLRLVLDQGYWRDSLMTAPHSSAFQYDIECIKKAGFNGVRKHQKIEDPDFLYWADVMGLMVWEEMPSSYRFTHESVLRLNREWTEVIDRDINHPSIVTWVPFNESWGVPDLADKRSHQSCVQALYHLTKTLDPSRPVIGNDGWESTATDILGIHDYDERPERIERKYSAKEKQIDEILFHHRPGGRVLVADGYPHSGQPLMLTEFGGIACFNSEGLGWGYSACKNGEELAVRYEALLASVNPLEIFAGFCYTQFTDTFQEANGLFQMDRTPKFSTSQMARATRGEKNIRGELLSTPAPRPIPDHG